MSDRVMWMVYRGFSLDVLISVRASKNEYYISNTPYQNTAVKDRNLCCARLWSSDTNHIALQNSNAKMKKLL